MAKRISQDTRSDIWQLGEAKVSVAAIAEQLDVSIPFVYKVLSEGGLRPAKPNPLTPEAQVDAFEMYRAGVPLTTICKKHGVNPQYIYQMLREANEPLQRDVQRLTFEQNLAKALTMYQSPEQPPIWQICRDCNISQPALYKAIHDYEIETRNVPRRISVPPIQEAS